MVQFSRIPFILGIAFTAMGLVIGCFAAQVSTFTCIRPEIAQPGFCRLEQSTLFLPWNKEVVSFPLKDIQNAKSVEIGVDSYTVVLRSRDHASNFLLHKSEYSENTQLLASQINSFLDNPQAKALSIREGGGMPETIVLLSFCGFGLLLTWQGSKFGRHPG